MLDPCSRCVSRAWDVPILLPLFLCSHFILPGCFHSNIELFYCIVEKWISCGYSLRFKVGLQNKILHHINHLNVEVLIESMTDTVELVLLLMSVQLLFKLLLALL